MSVVIFQDLPLADEKRRWSVGAAERRVRRWAGAGGEEGLSRRAARERYRRAFLRWDRDGAETFGGYKLQIADVIGGELRVVPRAVMAAGGVLDGARGGVDIPEAERRRCRAHLARYYRTMDRTPPWEG